PEVAVADDQLETLWNDLIGNDATKAFRALVQLAATPAQAVPLLRKNLKAEPRPGSPGQHALVISAVAWGERTEGAEEVGNRTGAGGEQRRDQEGDDASEGWRGKGWGEGSQ